MRDDDATDACLRKVENSEGDITYTIERAQSDRVKLLAPLFMGLCLSVDNFVPVSRKEQRRHVARVERAQRKSITRADKGHVVECIATGKNGLTRGVHYTVVAVVKGRLKVVNNYGRALSYPRRFFKRVS